MELTWKSGGINFNLLVFYQLFRRVNSAFNLPTQLPSENVETWHATSLDLFYCVILIAEE